LSPRSLVSIKILLKIEMWYNYHILVSVSHVDVAITEQKHTKNVGLTLQIKSRKGEEGVVIM